MKMMYVREQEDSSAGQRVLLNWGERQEKIGGDGLITLNIKDLLKVQQYCPRRGRICRRCRRRRSSSSLSAFVGTANYIPSSCSFWRILLFDGLLHEGSKLRVTFNPFVSRPTHQPPVAKRDEPGIFVVVVLVSNYDTGV